MDIFAPFVQSISNTVISQKNVLTSTRNAPLVFLVEAEDEGEHHVPLVGRGAVVEAVLLGHPLPPQERRRVKV